MWRRAAFAGTRMMADLSLPELDELEQLIAEGSRYFQFETACRIPCRQAGHERAFPVYALTIGNPDPAVPAVGFFGGIHGLERIGTRVLLVFLRSLLTRLPWDTALQRQLESLRMVFMPLINPAGMAANTRSNPNGVDLMRNAPLDATEAVPFLLGGHRISPRLPWYRGAPAGPMEPENLALCEVVRRELLGRSFSIALDCHSGFGLCDRIWFPYAHTVRTIPHLPEVHALKQLFDDAYPIHNYVFEPQSHQYLTHGDIWDHLYLGAATANPERVFLPLTLELGSWLWVRKNPRQLFSLQGLFNPQPQHRLQRVLRRHLLWLDFLGRAACGHAGWLPRGSERQRHAEDAAACWYAHRRPAVA